MKKEAQLCTSDSHSRNANDWSVTTDENGRHALVTKGRGVRYRIGLVVTALARGSARRCELLAVLQKKDPSYQDADLQQVFSQMKKHGIARVRGMYSDAIWTLTPKGKAIWNSIPKRWV